MAKRQTKKPTAKELFAKRSKAAIKGWRTRKRNELLASVSKLDKKVKSTKSQTREVLSRLPKKKKKKALAAVKPSKKRKKLGSKATKKELLERIAKLEKEAEESLRERELARLKASIDRDWIHIPGWTRADGTVALNYSSLRERPEAETLAAKLDKANEEGNLDYEAEQMAVYYDVPIREVYTLFYSR